jgi:hypothetical protein
MNKTTTSHLLLLIPIAILVFLFSCRGNPNEEDLPSDIEKYEFLEFSGGQAVFDPEDVVRADNNWELLLACKKPRTRENLNKMGISCTESQIMLLQAMGFIDIDDKDAQPESIQTTLSILGYTKKQALIQKVRKMAYEFAGEIEEDIHVLMDILKKTGHRERAFSIFFSFIVDGIAWFPFRSQAYVSEFELTLEKPLYDGIYWAYYPKREFRCGTNIALGNDLYVLLNWSDDAREKIQKVFNWTNLNQIHSDLLEQGRIVHAELRQALEPYGIVDAEGNLTVLTIEMNDDDPIFQNCQTLAAKVVQFIGAKMDLKELWEEFGFTNAETAFVVTYHEWMWELMMLLAEKGIVEIPFAFINQEEAEARDISRLIFVVKGKINQSG